MASNETSLLLSLPAHIWRFYIDTLVHYKPGSWVDSAARTFRVLALLLIAPFAILTMLVRCPALSFPVPRARADSLCASRMSPRACARP